MIWAGLAMPAQGAAPPLVVDFTTATGFGGGSLGPLEFQINGIKVDLPNPFNPTVVQTISVDVKWRFDNNPSSPSYLHLIPVGSATSGPGQTTRGTGTVTIRVNDASVSNSPLQGATVTQTGGASQTTDSTGVATFTGVPEGSPVQFTATATGFISASASVIPVANTTTSATISLTRPVAGGGFRIVLNWGADPRDLDSHITGPSATGTSRFHIYYSNKGSSTSTAEPSLDVDDTNGNGPETITIPSTALRSGTYRYSVHQFAGNSDICTKSAEIRVNLYQGSTLLRTFTPPARDSSSFCGGSMVWTVFTIDGDSSAITPVNTYTGPTGASSVSLRRQYAGALVESEDPTLFANLPGK